MKHSAKDTEHAEGVLRRCFPPGSTVYTVTRHVSRSRMQRVISVVAISEAGARPSWPNWAAHVMTGLAISTEPDGLRIRGVGFNHGRSIAEAISEALYGKADALNWESI